MDEQNVVQEPTETTDNTLKTETEEVDEVEFDDTEEIVEEKTETKTDEPSKKQSRDKNREYAQRRRERAQQEKEKSYYQGIKDTYGEINKFTNKKMETKQDFEDLADMLEMEKNGLDPLSSTDYIEFKREKESKILNEAKAHQEATNRYQKDITDFKAKYPTIDIEKLVEEDESWNNAIMPHIQSGRTLVEAYEAVNTLISKAVEEKAKVMADEQNKKYVQNTMASVGSQTNGEGVPPKVDINSMSDSEFHEYLKKRGWR